MNKTINIAGKTDMIFNASLALALSRMFPIMGNTIETDSIPAPPMIESPKAPLSGIYSATNDSIVGQKNVMPTAKMAAAKKVMDPLVSVNNQSPKNAKTAENSNIPSGLSLCAT